jgi:broad specificity phosphatase PhoE
MGFLWRSAPDRTVVAVSHGLALQSAMDVLARSGLVQLGGVRPPHLGNGEWIVLRVARTADRHGAGYAA